MGIYFLLFIDNLATKQTIDFNLGDKFIIKMDIAGPPVGFVLISCHNLNACRSGEVGTVNVFVS